MAAQDPILDQAPHAGPLHGARARLGLLRTIHVWGLRIQAPRRLLAPQERWLLRTGGLERPEALGVLRTLDRTLPVVELGGGIGLIACHTNRLLRRRDAHVVLEMDPRLLPYIERNKALNDAAFDVVHGAFAYGDGEAAFTPGRANYQGQRVSAAAAGTRVPATTLQALVEGQARRHPDQDWSHFNLVADVEGMEVQLLDREATFLSRHASRVLMELHPAVAGPERAAATLERMRQLGYALTFVHDAVYGFTRQAARR